VAINRSSVSRHYILHEAVVEVLGKGCHPIHPLDKHNGHGVVSIGCGVGDVVPDISAMDLAIPHLKDKGRASLFLHLGPQRQRQSLPGSVFALLLSEQHAGRCVLRLVAQHALHQRPQGLPAGRLLGGWGGCLDDGAHGECFGLWMRVKMNSSRV
jgi:hypothetical protein